jgi:hypothetical protein
MDRFRRQGCHRCYILPIACLATCLYAFGLDPSLDVSQYAHASWKLSETFGKGEVWAVSQTPDGYLWVGTEFNLRRFDGVRTLEWQPPPGTAPSRYERPEADDLPRPNAVDRHGGGLASWKSGKLTIYPEFDNADIGAVGRSRRRRVGTGKGMASGARDALQALRYQQRAHGSLLCKRPVRPSRDRDFRGQPLQRVAWNGNLNLAFQAWSGSSLSESGFQEWQHSFP